MITSSVPDRSPSSLLEIERDFNLAQEAAVLEIADQGLVSLAQLVQSKAIDVSPRFQRRDRWGADQQSKLIESFLVNIPVPPVYLAQDSSKPGEYAVIDGKQRLTAVALFFADDLVLRGLERLPRLNGYKYSQLPVSVRNPLGMKNLRVTTLLRQSNDDLKHEVFLRLNTGGEVLNAQEIRNVAYRGAMNDLIFELAENQFLRKQFKVIPPSSPAFRQMTDAEFVLRFFALSASWRRFKGDIRIELDNFMSMNRDVDDRGRARLSSQFAASVSAAEAIWGSDAFKWPGRDQSLAGLFDAQMIALSELTDPELARAIEKPSRTRAHVDRLFNDPEFEGAVRQGTNTPARLRTRVRSMHSALTTL